MFYLATNRGFLQEAKFINHGEIVYFTNDIREAQPFKDFINADMTGKYLSGQTFRQMIAYYAIVTSNLT